MGNSQNKSLEEMTQEVVRVFENYTSTGTKPWTADIAAADLSYQVGSLAKAFLQLRGERYSAGKSEAELKEKIGDELADIVAEVLFIAHEMNIDIVDTWEKMIASDQGKIKERSTK